MIMKELPPGYLEDLFLKSPNYILRPYVYHGAMQTEDVIFNIIIPPLHHFTILGQKNT